MPRRKEWNKIGYTTETESLIKDYAEMKMSALKEGMIMLQSQGIDEELIQEMEDERILWQQLHAMLKARL